MAEINRRGIHLLIIAGLILVFDRLEFLYYAVPDPEKLTGFWYKGDPIRADAYWYFASLRVQYMVFAAIVYTLLPELKRALGIYFWLTFLYFIEYFITYNEPITRIEISYFFSIPISVTLLKFFGLTYLVVEVLRKVFLI